MRDKRLVVAGIALALVAVTARHPATSLDLTLLTHDANDPAPHRLKAAVDLGIAGVSILYTWTGGRLR